ncbi:MAG: glycosyltransferase family 39 protein [bacterium]|nr:glycosyltransferase family 39 protein [bacterium]
MNLGNRKKEWIVFILIVLIAVFFRFYQIGSFPPGLYPDEAMNGNNALSALETGSFKVFYPENNGREGLFINIQALSIDIFGIHPWSLRIVSGLIGTLTVIGLYFLTKELFDWHQGALASFLLAISFWHVNFSRIGFRAIMLPFILVFGFYFFWRGLKKASLLNFGIAGLFWGLGAYTYISSRVAPLILIFVLIIYWLSVRKDFSLTKYKETKNKILKGLAVFMTIGAIVALPIIIYFLQNPDHFLSRTGANLSVFNQASPIKELGLSILKTLGMFNFSGDYNWRHNISGWPMLSLPIGLFFFLGFFKELGHWLKRKHGRFSSTHTLVFSWFFVMLLPGFLSTEAPHALRTIGVIPVVMIFAAQGLYWVIVKLYKWHTLIDPHANKRESRTLAKFALVVFLTSLVFLEYHRYFNVWAKNQETIGAFNQNYVDLADEINNSPNNIRKYIVVNTGGVLVNNLPMPAQTVMFLTDTFTQNKQIAKNVFYLTGDQYKTGDYHRNSVIFLLEK